MFVLESMMHSQLFCDVASLKIPHEVKQQIKTKKIYDSLIEFFPFISPIGISKKSRWPKIT